MEGSRKSNKKAQVNKDFPKEEKVATRTSLPVMRMIVTTSTRNPWVDEQYETPPQQANLPIYH